MCVRGAEGAAGDPGEGRWEGGKHRETLVTGRGVSDVLASYSLSRMEMRRGAGRALPGIRRFGATSHRASRWLSLGTPLRPFLLEQSFSSSVSIEIA